MSSLADNRRQRDAERRQAVPPRAVATRRRHPGRQCQGTGCTEGTPIWRDNFKAASVCGSWSSWRSVAGLRRPNRWQRTVALLLVCSIILLPAYGQQPQELTVDLVNARIDAIQASGNPDESIEAAYEEARAFLIEAQASDQQAEDYSRALTTAPAQQDVIQTRLDAMEDSYDAVDELAGLSPAVLDARLGVARRELDELTRKVEEADRGLGAREANRARLEARLAEIEELLRALPATRPDINSEGQPSSQEAELWRGLAEASSLAAERRALQARLASQPVRYDLMATARAENAANLERTKALVSLLESYVTAVDEAVVDPITLGFDPNDPAFPLAEEITEELGALHEQQLKLNDRLQHAREQTERIEGVSRVIAERYNTAQRIVEFAEGSKALGQVLLTYWNELREFSIVDPTAIIPQMAGDLVIERLKHEEVLEELFRATAYLNSRMRLAQLEPDTVSSSTYDRLLSLVRSYREQLRGVVSDQSEYLEALSSLDEAYQAFSATLVDYRQYLESMLLWIPNHPPLWNMSIASLVADAEYTESKLELMRYTSTVGSGFLAVAAALLVLSRRRLRDRQKVLNDRISRPRDDSIRFTLIALFFVVLRAAPAPMIILALALGFDPAVSAENSTVQVLFIRLAILVFTFLVLRTVCEPGGIGTVHFKWSQTVVERSNRQLTFLTRWWLPLLMGAAIVHNFAPQSGDEAAGRLLLLFALLILGIQLVVPQLAELRQTGRSWFDSKLNRLRAAFSVLLVLGLYSILVGQVFTVIVIINVLINSFCILALMLLVHAVLARWLRVASRRLRMGELLAQRREQAGDESLGVEGRSVEESVPDLVDISSETQQLITFATVLIAALALMYIWAPLLPALEGLSRIALWTSSSEVDGATTVNTITLATLLTVVLLAAFTLLAAKRLPALVELTLRSRTSVTPGARYTASTMLNYVIIGSGIFAGLSALGLQWSQLQWLVAALGVGIGFGLQEIVANFISGLIILFERPIRVGDVVTIGDRDGFVIRIRIRATTIRDWDGRELLVPNKEFITGRLLNWTLSDSYTRLEVPVGIAYGSDVEKALALLDKVVRNYPNVMEEPEPTVLFLGFGESSLNLVARCFSSRIEDRLPITSGLHTVINREFEKAGIVIAFPQLDVHLDKDSRRGTIVDVPPVADY